MKAGKNIALTKIIINERPKRLEVNDDEKKFPIYNMRYHHDKSLSTGKGYTLENMLHASVSFYVIHPCKFTFVSYRFCLT